MAPQSHRFGYGFDSQRLLEVPLGIAIIVFTVVFKVVWVISWSLCLLTPAVFRRKLDPSARDIMQTDDDYLREHRLPHGPIPWTGQRMLKCPQCGSLRPDRTFHCAQLDRCLPVYDHFCSLLLTAVYLDTIKPYLYLLVFLSLDALVTIATCVAVLARGWSGGLQWPFIAALFPAVVVIGLIAQVNAYKRVRGLAFQNITDIERNSRLGGSQVPLVFKIDGPSGRHMRW